ncbi:MAG TPA: YkgJ family cysteine cluster protein [Pseudobdellovibrionaceae bacterium]|nr:YkgJ family cysteine cluster protein [Pseudobdellovibrionaceae bacterium]
MNIKQKTDPRKEETSTEKTRPWWVKGIQFECQGSGQCCVSHGEYGNVYLTPKDRARMAKVLKIPTRLFTQQFCEKVGGIFRLKEDSKNGNCQFLKNKKCSIYEGRPTQCRTWPFWPEVMDAKTWNQEVATFCPGVGKGRVYTEKEIRKQLNDQILSEKQYGK